MKHVLAMVLGLMCTLVGLDAWAGTLAPKIERSERLVLDDTFYEQNTQLDAIVDQLRVEQKPKIIGLGDSTMYGSVVYQNETIPYFLRGFVQQQVPNADVVNLAYPGARPADLYAMLKLAKQAKPDLVFIDVNAVFFSERILGEGALADKKLSREFLFEQDVPKGVFTENRIEETFKSLLANTNIGTYRQQINDLLFHRSPRAAVQQVADKLQPKQAAPANAAGAVDDIIGKSWHDKQWGDTERKNMARIYEQGPLTEDNDSVKMLRKMIAYAQDNHINALFYITPQNEALIGKFFSVAQLNQNEDKLKQILTEQNAWFLDLRNAVPENQFGDYDHMLKDGNRQVAQALAKEIEDKGALHK